MKIEKVFVEYAIAEHALEEYRTFMRERLREFGDVEGGCAEVRGGFEWFEGTDQPGLFVEIWPSLSYEDYLEIKRRRTDPADPKWGQLADWIKGGLGKLHAWHFTALG